MIVYEYILDTSNNITTVQLWGECEKPECAGNPVPNQDILDGKLFDAFGNPLYRLESGEIIANEIVLDDTQTKIDKLSKKSLLNIIRILIQGIEDSLDSEFVALKEEILG